LLTLSHWLVIDLQLLFDGIIAHSVLWHIRFDNEAKTQRLVYAVPWLVPMCQMTSIFRRT